MRTEALVSDYIVNGLKCPAKYNGSHYLRECVIALVYNGDQIGCLNSLYLSLAERHRTKPYNIERCIRTLTKGWWEESKCGGLFAKSPSNSELIHTIVAQVKIKMMKVG